MEILSPLESAITQLRAHYNLIGSGIAAERADIKRAFRTAAIKSYEYAYELAVRLIRRRLQRTAPSAEDIAQMDFKPLMRLAAERGIIDDPVAWFLYREKRNETAHTYDETKALDVLT